MAHFPFPKPFDCRHRAPTQATLDSHHLGASDSHRLRAPVSPGLF